MAHSLIAWGTKNVNTSAQLVLAKRLGFFREEGLEVRCKLFPSEEQFTRTFETSIQKPFVWSQTVPDILSLRATGFPVRIIAPLADVSASYQVILREDAGIVLPGDLEGCKIGIVRGSLIEVAFRHMASDFDVNLSTIHFVNASPVQQLELFVNGEIDAMACWEPWASQAQYVGGIFYFSGLYSNIPGHEGPVNWLTGQSMLVTFEERISKEPDLLIAFLKAMEKATNYLHATLNKAVSVFSDLLGIERHELAELLQKNMYTMNMDDDFQIGLVSVLNMFASNPEFLNGRNVPELTELYDSHLLIQVNPVLVQLPPINPRQDEIEIITEGNIYYPARVNIHRPGTAPLRYIIIDDTQIVVEIFSTIIDMMEGEVVGTASTGTEAFVLYIDLLPDVVVMDISMPDMNGIEAMKSIFGMNPTANIIVISGNDYEDIRQEVFQLGAKLFIGKPFHIDQIMEVLEKLIIS